MKNQPSIWESSKWQVTIRSLSIFTSASFINVGILGFKGHLRRDESTPRTWADTICLKRKINIHRKLTGWSYDHCKDNILMIKEALRQDDFTVIEKVPNKNLPCIQKGTWWQSCFISANSFFDHLVDARQGIFRIDMIQVKITLVHFWYYNN